MSQFQDSVYKPGPVARRLLSMFDSYGNSDYIGEPVSIIGHSLQAADCAREGGDDEVMVAALLHDIGHVVGMESGYPLGMNGCGFPGVRQSDIYYIFDELHIKCFISLSISIYLYI